MKATAVAPSNIAFIKYWGKKNSALRLPANSSISMNLSHLTTTTEVEFSQQLSSDKVSINSVELEGEEKIKIIEFTDTIRRQAGILLPVSIISQNNFPSASGMASSASGFAALSLAVATAAGLKLSLKQLSILARQGSGSACRSIPDGFVEWKSGNSSETSYATSLYPPDYWDILDIVAVFDIASKKVSSTTGHSLADSSPFYKTRLQGMSKKIQAIKAALKLRDFTSFGQIIEAEAVNMHAVMMTSIPPIFYWNSDTIILIHSINEWRKSGLECYFTIDAGPNVHIICEKKNQTRITDLLSTFAGIKDVIVNSPAVGARTISSTT